MEISRRSFIKKSALACSAFSALGMSKSFSFPAADLNVKLSLAQWSLHKALFEKKISALDFPVVAKKKYGFEGVEYVNQFFLDKAEDHSFLKELQLRCSDHGVKSLLIMVDLEGQLSAQNQSSREKAVENHKKWIQAAKTLGCHSIRVNLHSELNGQGNPEDWINASVESLSKLSEFAAGFQINVLAENHGGYSSHAGHLKKVIQQVNKKNCLVLLDIANFCVEREKGDLWESSCVLKYERYKGIEELLPYAKGVSAKTFDFDDKGNETTTDMAKIFELLNKNSFNGYIGIEYEGERLTEEDGITKSKLLIEKTIAHLKR